MNSDGLIIPFDRISPETLRSMVEEFVTREWSEIADSGYSLDDKIRQVLQQLRDGTASVVFDATSETCNIVPTDRLPKDMLEDD
jgi:uncharacterized protein YheU (UPF0270 family)